MNIFSTITAVNAIILFGLDFIFITDPNYGCFDDYNCHRNNALLMVDILNIINCIEQTVLFITYITIILICLTVGMCNISFPYNRAGHRELLE